MTPAAPAFDVRELTVNLGGQTVLDSVSFNGQQGEVLGIVGPNGAGKTTLLRAVLGLIPHREGTVELLGHPLAAVREQVGYMPQAKTLNFDLPMRVRDLVRMGTFAAAPGARWRTVLNPARWREQRERQEGDVRDALELVGMEDLAARRIGQLSGGQQQRVLLARTIAQQPRFIALDEPFAGVDARSEHIILAALRQLCAQGASIVLVHHDLSSVRTFCDRALLLNRRVIAHGPVDEVLTAERIGAAYGGAAEAVAHSVRAA